MKPDSTAPADAPVDPEVEHKTMLAIIDMGQMAQSLARSIKSKQTEEAKAKAAIKVLREEIRQKEKEREEVVEELTLLAAGKHSERLPFGKGGKPAPVQVTDPELYKAVRLDGLTDPKALAPGKIKTLAEHEPPIVTIGDLQAWQAKKGAFWAQDIKGLGKGGQQQVEDLLEAYFAANRQPAAGTATATAGAPAAAKPSTDPPRPLDWKPDGEGVIRADSAVSDPAAADNVPFYFAITAMGGKFHLGGSSEILYESPAEPFDDQPAAMAWCEARNQSLAEVAESEDTAAAATPAAPAPAAPAPAAPAGAAAGESPERACELLGLTDDKGLSDVHVAALRTGHAHADGIITADQKVLDRLHELDLLTPDQMGDPHITGLGLAAMGIQPQLNACLAARQVDQVAAPEPAGEPAPAAAAEAEAPKRKRGRPRKDAAAATA